MSLRWAQLLLPLLCATACGPAGTGEVDSETGLVGAPQHEGSLAGTWAQRTVFATIVTIPVLGEREGGGGSTRLVHRTWDAKARRYEETFVRCTNDVAEVEGTRTIVKDETLGKIAPVTYRVSADHGAGEWRSEDVLDIWGVRNLPDPVETPLPTKDNYTQAPQRDWMWDEDDDGNPGVTVLMRGTLGADVYVCKRNVYTFDGTVVSEDRIQGLIRQTKTESHSVASTVTWLAGEGEARPDPDPLRSWFDMVRLPNGATCTDVKAAAADGRLRATRPF